MLIQQIQNQQKPQLQDLNGQNVRRPIEESERFIPNTRPTIDPGFINTRPTWGSPTPMPNPMSMIPRMMGAIMTGIQEISRKLSVLIGLQSGRVPQQPSRPEVVPYRPTNVDPSLTQREVQAPVNPNSVESGGGFFDKLGSIFKTGKRIYNGFTKIKEQGLGLYNSFKGGIDKVTNFVKPAWNGITNFLGGAANKIGSLVSNGWSFLSGLF